MSAEETLKLTPEQQSDLEAASEQVYVEAADEVIGQTTGLDIAALLTIGVAILMVYILSADLRTTKFASALMPPLLDSLRKVMTIVLGFLALTVFVGERDT